MRRIILIVLVVLTSQPLMSQDLDKIQSKMDRFVSKTGSILKFTDYKQPGLKTNYDVVETKIRTIEGGGEIGYFFQIVKEDITTQRLLQLSMKTSLRFSKRLLPKKGRLLRT